MTMVMVANDQMIAENAARFQARRAELAQRKRDEERRVKEAQAKREKQLRLRTSLTLIEDEGEKRPARKLVTLCDKMVRAGQLPGHLKVAVSAFALLVASGTGAATEEGADSTNRLTAGYAPATSLSGFGSKTPSDRQLAGLTAMREMRARVPDDMMNVFLLVVMQETGQGEGKKTLSQLGEELGYHHKQAASAGAMAIFAVASLISLYLKDKSVTASNGRRR